MKRFSDGMFGLIHPRYGNQVWTTSTVRKNFTCRICRVELQGKRAWRPTTNSANRGDRICDVRCLDIYEKTVTT